MFKSLLRLTKHSAIYGLGHVLTKSLVILLLPIHTNFIDKAEYGVATEIFAFLAIAGVIYSYGLNTAFLQFYILAKDPQKRKKFFSTAFFSTALTSVIFSVILYVTRHFISVKLFGSEHYAYLLNYSIGILTFDALVLLAFNILRAEERSASFAFFSVANVGMNLVLNLVFVAHYSMGVKGIFLSNIISSGLIFMLLLPITFKHLVFSISWTILKPMLKFGLPFIPATISVVFINSIDRFFITKYLGLEATGIYGAGYKLGLTVKLFINAFQFAWLPFFMATASQENAREIFSKILTYFALICSVIFLFVSMFIDQIVRLRVFGFTIFGQEYWGSTPIVPVVILGYIAYGFHLNFLVGIYLKEKTKYLMYITMSGALINVIGNILLIPTYKLMGAAYATAISFIFMAIVVYATSQHYYKIKYEFDRILKIILFSALIMLTYSQINWPYISIIKILLLFSYFAILYLSGFFKPIEIKTIKQFIKGFSWQS